MCEECARPFIREDYLRNHMKTHKRKNAPPDVSKKLLLFLDESNGILTLAVTGTNGLYDIRQNLSQSP